MSITKGRPPVWFVDTSILDNILPVPGWDQDGVKVGAELAEKIGSREALILPVAAVIETGNHIAQVQDGRVRRQVAQKFASVLSLVAKDQAPWKLHSLAWDTDFLELLVERPAPGGTLVELAQGGLAGGDICILAEREMYKRRTGISDVRIWTLDRGLDARN